jgi:hypothetical protein
VPTEPVSETNPPGTWHRHVTTGLGSDADKVVVFGDRFYALATQEGSREFVRSVATSDDGISWRTVAREPFDNRSAHGLSLVGDRLVVFADRSIDDPDGFDRDVWWSADGSTWRRWDSISDGAAVPTLLGKLDRRWVAVDDDSAVLISDDGEAWREARRFPWSYRQWRPMATPGRLVVAVTEELRPEDGFFRSRMRSRSAP